MVYYIARVKKPKDTIEEREFDNLSKAKNWLQITLKNYKCAIGELEERRRNYLGLLVESTIKYYYTI